MQYRVREAGSEDSIYLETETILFFNVRVLGQYMDDGVRIITVDCPFKIEINPVNITINPLREGEFLVKGRVILCADFHPGLCIVLLRLIKEKKDVV